MKTLPLKIAAGVIAAALVLFAGLNARDDAFGNKTQNQTSAAARNAVKEKTKSPKTAGRPNNSNTADIDKPLSEILREKGITGQIPDLKIVVDKSDHVLTLYSGDTPLKQYQVAIGDGGLDDKQKAGDHKTPEGTFYIAERSVLSPPDEYLGTRWFRVSYPNIEDARRGLDAGLIDQRTADEIIAAINNNEIPPQRTALGGGVGIHGGSGLGKNQGDYWTWGCIGLRNTDIEEFFDYILTGTALVITP